MFILILQFFWVYIDDLMGKGLSVWIILELLFYISASLIPLALPLAILLSSLMTFGNLAEKSELTALKSNGFSLLRIMRPLTVIIVFLSIFTFYFSNYIIPLSNLKWHSLIYDIQNTKLTQLIKPGVYTSDIEGYSIKVNKDDQGKLKDIIIHDHSVPNALRTIKAKKVNIARSHNGSHLFFELTNGTIFEELSTPTGQLLPNGKPEYGGVNTHPDRISRFEKATYRMNVTGMTVKRSDEEIFKDKFEMLNVFQIKEATANNNIIMDPNMDSVVSSVKPYEKISLTEKRQLMSDVVYKLYQINQNIRNQEHFMETLDNEESQYWIEFHRKFALSYSVIILFFVGAPLGAIVRKGGFGAPVVIAAILFVIYFIILSIGDNLADSYVVSPWLGMWLPGMFFTPIAIALAYIANNDLSVTINPRAFFKRLRTKNIT
jgi:lipopolysaccharide export system permease protein